MIFDGTSYYVGDENMSEEADCEIIKSSSNLDYLNELADKANEEAYP